MCVWNTINSHPLPRVSPLWYVSVLMILITHAAQMCVLSGRAVCSHTRTLNSLNHVWSCRVWWPERALARVATAGSTLMSQCIGIRPGGSRPTNWRQSEREREANAEIWTCVRTRDQRPWHRLRYEWWCFNLIFDHNLLTLIIQTNRFTALLHAFWYYGYSHSNRI